MKNEKVLPTIEQMKQDNENYKLNLLRHFDGADIFQYKSIQGFHGGCQFQSLKIREVLMPPKAKLLLMMYSLSSVRPPPVM